MTTRKKMNLTIPQLPLFWAGFLGGGVTGDLLGGGAGDFLGEVGFCDAVGLATAAAVVVVGLAAEEFCDAAGLAAMVGLATAGFFGATGLAGVLGLATVGATGLAAAVVEVAAEFDSANLGFWLAGGVADAALIAWIL